MSIKIVGVHHIMITVGNLGEARDFYSNILGLKEKPIPPEIEGERVWYYLGDTELHVNVHPQNRAGMQHFALSVERDQYNKYIQQLKDSGYEKMSESRKFIDGMCRVYIDDPFSNCIEIIDGQLGD